MNILEKISVFESNGRNSYWTTIMNDVFHLVKQNESVEKTFPVTMEQ
jgi:hypothetical protein